MNIFLLVDEVAGTLPTIWEQLTSWCEQYAPTLYTIIGSLTSGSFILLIWKGIPKLAKLFGLNDATVSKVQTVVDKGTDEVKVVAHIYAKMVDQLKEELKEQYDISEAKDDIIVQMLYTIITDSKIQASGKQYATELLTKFEGLTTKNVGLVQAQLSEALKEQIADIPTVIAEANKEVAEQEEEVSIVKAISGE